MTRASKASHHSNKRLAFILQCQNFSAITILAFLFKPPLHFNILRIKSSGRGLRRRNSDWRDRRMGPEQMDIGIAQLRAEIMKVRVTPNLDFIPDLQRGMRMAARDRKSPCRVLYV